MKPILIALLLSTSLQVHAYSCHELQSETANAFRNWKETVQQCLNDYEPGLAGQFEKPLRLLAEACVGSCHRDDFESKAYCAKIPLMVQRYKKIHPLRCAY